MSSTIQVIVSIGERGKHTLPLHHRYMTWGRRCMTRRDHGSLVSISSMHMRPRCVLRGWSGTLSTSTHTVHMQYRITTPNHAKIGCRYWHPSGMVVEWYPALHVHSQECPWKWTPLASRYHRQTQYYDVPDTCSHHRWWLHVS